ncbi:MAG TPA: RDD family protein [Pyrinomonadaceae bacterium]|jgi:uncharacterized RDD family membrane protein YckC|nr:RDD family protein [Pyrinomonadaceae bacterium]
MQCSSCRAVYSNGLETCPRCKTPAATNTSSSAPEAIAEGRDSEEKTEAAVATANTNGDEMAAAETVTAPVVSTLIEFPGAGRAPRPQWRKQLSERVREIQERRAREAEEAARHPAAPPAEATAPQLGLVPAPDVPEINPLVAAALRRIERAHQPSPSSSPRARSGGGGAATAVARFIEDEYQPESTRRPYEAQASAAVTLPEADKTLKERPSEVARERGLVVVAPAPQPAVPSRVDASNNALPSRRVAAPVIDDATVENALTEESTLLEVERYDDRAPLHGRILAGIIDLFVIAFASSPFAAIIELTNGNWADMRVTASMGGIILVIMFLYLTASTALSGRTWGMSLLSLRAVDADEGLPPTTRQAVTRALVYMVSLATAGLGLLYALFDAEGRTIHDHFSGTVVVRE